MAGFSNDTVYGTNVDFSGNATVAPTMVADGQLLIGATAAPNIRVATLTAGAGISITNGAGTISIAATGGLTPVAGLIPDAHTPPGTTPVVGDGSGNITITGAQVAAGVVGANVIRTDSLNPDTMTIEIQRSTTAAVSTTADNGVSHFDSAIFTVDAGGFVSLVGGAVPPSQKFDVDAHTAPGTDPVVPTALGVVSITGAQVAAGVVGTNVIRTDSLVANTYTIEIQRATSAAVSTVADNGVSHYDSAVFTVGANGFVSLVGGSVPPAQKFAVDASTPPGTNPVVPTAGGIVTITGGQVATGVVGTNVIRSNSTAANEYAIEIQRSTAVAGSDVTKNGVAHFNSANFTVDTNGFVSSVGGGGSGAWQLIETQTPSVVNTVIFNTNLANFTELMAVFNLTTTTPNQLLMHPSADNGSTFLTGNYAFGGNSSNVFLFIIGNLYGGLGGYGSVNINNLPGTVPRNYNAQFLAKAAPGGADNTFFGFIDASAKINYIKFDHNGFFSGTIYMYGR